MAALLDRVLPTCYAIFHGPVGRERRWVGIHARECSRWSVLCPRVVSGPLPREGQESTSLPLPPIDFPRREEAYPLLPPLDPKPLRGSAFEKLLANWQRAVQRSLGWEVEEGAGVESGVSTEAVTVRREGIGGVAPSL